MSKLVEYIREALPLDVFTYTEVKNLIQGSADSRYGLIKRALARGEIVRIRRGLYGLSKRYQRGGISTFELAQKIYSPSYVSLESALSFHGWIPEAVYTVTSVSLKRSRDFETTFGRFSYKRIPKFSLIGVDRIEADKSLYFMATPTKAIIDYLYVYRKEWKGMGPLIESLRIEPKNLEGLSVELLLDLAEGYRSKRVKLFVKGLVEDLKL